MPGRYQGQGALSLTMTGLRPWQKWAYQSKRGGSAWFSPGIAGKNGAGQIHGRFVV